MREQAKRTSKESTPSRPFDVKELDAQIEQLNQEKEAAVMEQDFCKAAHLFDQCNRLKKRKERIMRRMAQKLQGD
jgi:ATP-dependent Clp protease ATP-binding subunit ClpC